MVKSMRQRVINDLKWVEAATPPPFATRSKLKGMAAKGKAYERKVCKMLTRAVLDGRLSGELWLGPWFKFEDATGPGMAQPDALLVTEERIIIFEAKLKQTSAAEPQIRLYGALAERLLGKPWVGVQIYRWPSSGLRQSTTLDRLPDVVGSTLKTTSDFHYLG